MKDALRPTTGIPEGALQRNGAFYEFLQAAGLDQGL
jgi:hypothetical protein